MLGRGIFVVDGALYDAMGARRQGDGHGRRRAHLPGAHNWQNAALAYGAVKPFVTDPSAIAAAIASFPGLAHRMEDVGHIGKTAFINDSKATNADATAGAGGLSRYFLDRRRQAQGRRHRKPGRIFPAHPQGLSDRRSRAAFARTLDGKAPYEMSGTLDVAVASAAIDAAASPAPAPVVLLSPACASYDQFKDFEQRGDAFRALVAKLPRDATFENSSVA